MLFPCCRGSERTSSSSERNEGWKISTETKVCLVAIAILLVMGGTVATAIYYPVVGYCLAGVKILACTAVGIGYVIYRINNRGEVNPDSSADSALSTENPRSSIAPNLARRSEQRTSPSPRAEIPPSPPTVSEIPSLQHVSEMPPSEPVPQMPPPIPQLLVNVPKPERSTFIDKEILEAYVKTFSEEHRPIIKKLTDNIRHITFHEFQTNLNNIITCKLIPWLRNKKNSSVAIGFAKEGSSEWVASQVAPQIGQFKQHLFFLNNTLSYRRKEPSQKCKISDIQSYKEKVFLIFDDCTVDGYETMAHLSSIDEKLKKKFYEFKKNVIVVIPFISLYALERITQAKFKNINVILFYSSTLDLANDVLTKEERGIICDASDKHYNDWFDEGILAEKRRPMGQFQSDFGYNDIKSLYYTDWYYPEENMPGRDKLGRMTRAKFIPDFQPMYTIKG